MWDRSVFNCVLASGCRALQGVALWQPIFKINAVWVLQACHTIGRQDSREDAASLSDDVFEEQQTPAGDSAPCAYFHVDATVSPGPAVYKFALMMLFQPRAAHGGSCRYWPN